MINAELLNTYKERIEIYKLKEIKLRKKLVWVSFLRFFSFIGIFVFLVQYIRSENIFYLIFSLLLTIIFVKLILIYSKHSLQLKHTKSIIQINKDEIEVLNNNFSKFDDGSEFIDREHPYSFDLDIFGPGSVFQYLNRTFSWLGKKLLAHNLLYTKKNKKEIEDIHQAINELKTFLDWRQNLTATGRITEKSDYDHEQLSFWITQKNSFIDKPFIWILVIFSPLITFLALTLSIFETIDYSFFITFALLQLLIISIFLSKTNKIHSVVTSQGNLLKNYSNLIFLIDEQDFKSTKLIEIQKKLTTGPIKAGSTFRKLIRIIDAFDTRLNIFLGLVLNALFLWDIISVLRIELWKKKYGASINGWIHVVAEFDVLCSMSNFYYNNPSYIFPVINNNQLIYAKNIGHPLIHSSKRINNDFAIENPGNIVITTGANMAGKSTFLRTIGVNIVFALMGLPVCASELNIGIVNLYTGMRTSDSLKENESYFHAELKRLKHIIDTIKEQGSIFILLDEILKGTNSIDKAAGSRKFIQYLISLKATGIVATHDLSLCELEKEYPENIKNMSFEVNINGTEITFDYKLRDGIVQNMNASLLMKQMGIFPDI